MKCRACGSKQLESVLDLGYQYIVDFLTQEQLRFNDHDEPAPLNLVLCTECKLLQLDNSVEPDRLYKQFWYLSGVNEMMRAALRDVVEKSIEHVKLEENDAVLDIGSNDGTMLDYYPEGIKKCGVDPAENMEQYIKLITDHYVTDYFSANAVRHLLDESSDGFKIITAIAMFYDLEDPLDFLMDIKEVLHPEGVFVAQQNYLATMINNNAFDNIGHEHLCYYSLHSLMPLFDKADLRIIDVEINKVNGGSFRIYAGHKETHDVSEKSVMNLLAKESQQGLDKVSTFKVFGARVQEICTKVENYIRNQWRAGDKVYVYGASTRGSTLLQSLSLPNGIIKGAAERSPSKYGKFTIGTWLPISPEEAVREVATLFVVLPWHFAPAIIGREIEWLASGGKMLFPLPQPTVVTWNHEKGEHERCVL